MFLLDLCRKCEQWERALGLLLTAKRTQQARLPSKDSRLNLATSLGIDVAPDISWYQLEEGFAIRG